MKKVLTICLMAIMIVSTCLAPSAAPNGFISSPSGNPAPEIEGFDPNNEDCTAYLVITPYAERNDLSDVLKKMMENAYNDIVTSTLLTDLCDDFASLVSSKNIDPSKLAVSDLFDIHVTGCDFHDGHVGFEITLKAETLKNFVGLLHMEKDGEWHLVSDAEVINNGECLKFSVETLSPFAIVVETDDEADLPNTGESGMINLYVILMAVSALALMILFINGRKQRV